MIPVLVTATPDRRTAERIVPARRAPVRRAAHVVVGCAMFAVIVNTWFVQGLTAPAIIASGSMAPALLGPHRQWRCTDCGHDFRCSTESLPEGGSAAVCSNCGAHNAAERGADRPGDAVLVDRATLLWRSPRRWETVVFRDPRQSTALCVKRVVGLPGEEVEIRGGDVVIDGRVAVKNLAELRTMAVNVYDAPAADRRWQTTAGGLWQSGGEGVLYRRAASRNAEIDWLSYRHENGFHRCATSAEAAIVDESPVDQAESRPLTPVADILLDCQLQAVGAGDVSLRIGSAGDEFTVRIDVDSGRGELAHNGRTLAAFSAGALPLRSGARVELILADRQVRLVLDGLAVAVRQYQPSAGAGAQVAAIGARGAAVEVRRLQILRDVHYTSGPASGGAKYRLGPNEYFVLGDNSPHALDSRAESFGRGILADAIVGRAVRWRTDRKDSTGQGGAPSFGMCLDPLGWLDSDQ